MSESKLVRIATIKLEGFFLKFLIKSLVKLLRWYLRDGKDGRAPRVP